MARLRGENDAAEDSDAVKLPKKRVQRPAAESRTQRRRSSDGGEDGESGTGERKVSASLVPKSQPVSRVKKTQVKLSGLNTLSSSNSLTGTPEPEALRKGSSRRRLEPKEPKKTASSKLAEVQVVVKDLDLDKGEEEVDIEESVWCGSHDESDSSSGEELLSPRKLFAQPRRTNPANKNGPDLAKQLQALSIFDDDEDELPSKKRSPRKQKPETVSRRPSSSDKENNGGLIFFPPPKSKPLPRRTSIERPSTPPPPPASPSKSKLQSPSKKAPRVPTPPMRPSLDAFWTADAINDWNDQYSPQKPLRSPRKLKLQPGSEEASPTTSPTKPSSPTKRTKAELEAKKDFEARKHKLAESFLSELDQTITHGQIASLSATTGGVQLLWSNTLNSTAGRANWRRETTKSRNPRDNTYTLVHKHFASIELATKVISTPHRLLNVLAHEFCHLANFMISGVKDQPHGKQFKEWGRLCTKAFGDRGVEVTTKHSYEIEYKYVWRCEGEECGVEFKRHSRSIDPSRQRCGVCRGGLVQVRPVPRKGNNNASGAAGGKGKDVGTPGNGYAAYVKMHFAEVKKGMPGKSHKEVMEALGRKYRAEKAGGVGDGKLNIEKVAIDFGGWRLDGRESPVVIDSD